MKKLYFLFLALITSLFVKAQCNSTNSPTFQLAGSPTGNFTVGCNSQSITTICILNPNTNPTPGGALQFGFIPPGQSNVPLTSVQCITVNAPGVWTVVVADANGCQTKLPAYIIQNTVSPNISVIAPTQILSCATPSAVLTGQSTNTAAVYNWLLPTGGSFPNSSTLSVSTTTNWSNPNAGTYTLVVTDNDNGCTSHTVIPMQQNLFPPTASISATSKTITCLTPSIQLTNASATGIPPASGFPNTGYIQVVSWEPPVGSSTSTGTNSSYMGTSPGFYTLTVRDLNNGCISSTIINLPDGRVYPVVNNPPFHLCTNTVEIYPTLVSNAAAYSYSWTPNSAIVSANTTTSSIIVNAIGIYSVSVTNTLSGCATNGTVMVTTCVGIAENQLINFHVYPNPSAGEFFFEGNFSEVTQIIISDVVGKQIMKSSLIKGNNSIKIKEESGLYFYQIISNGKQAATGKLLVE